jgi:hypothetical protein
MPLYLLICSLLFGDHMSRPSVDKRNWMLLQIGGRLFWDVIQTATSTRSCSGPCPDSWTGEVYSVRPVRFEFRSEGYICFAPSKCGSQVQNSSALGIFAIATFNALGFLDRSVERWATRSINSSFRGHVLECSPLRNW